MTAFNQMQLVRFTQLGHFHLTGSLASDVNSIAFPISISNLGIGRMISVNFPNLTFGRFPNLRKVNADDNLYRQESNFHGVTTTLKKIIINRSNLYSADGLELLLYVTDLEIQNNKLETLSDLFGLPDLKTLYISGNSRMNCNQRMCWGPSQ